VKRRPTVYVIAGSNGAGKTTFATNFFPRFVGKVDFVNADLIARGLSPFDPDGAAISAGRILLQRIVEPSREKATFALETTLFGRGYVRLLKLMRKAGYRVHLYYLWIPNVATANRRIEERVRKGGHYVSPEVVRRRFLGSLNNLFHVYFDLADHIAIIDNAKDEPRVIAQKTRSRFAVIDKTEFDRIQKLAGFHA